MGNLITRSAGHSQQPHFVCGGSSALSTGAESHGSPDIQGERLKWIIEMRSHLKKKLGEAGYARPVTTFKVEQKSVMVILRDIMYWIFETKIGEYIKELSDI